ncbi:MAG TPA: diacylglycerol kinase family protein [Spirochaetota bacterium]|nr:diacylglycerol kinase family protein [Spirochaetota bacterium]HOM39172.1 diacylglycerol kinase family protein [Spirochaetota bacterium]HPQ50026.1 diacylglycerol kinase family protein [Spirochaetota bacterium]
MTSDQQKILLVLNPKAGKRKTLRDKDKLIKLINSYGYNCFTYITNGKNDYLNIRRIKENEQIAKVIVCGGDGTLNMVVTSLYDYVSELTFIFLPYGSINIFAKENNYPKDPVYALEMILKNRNVINLKPGVINNKKIFLLMTSVGFDSHLVYKVQTSKNKYMFFNYIFRFFTEIFRYDFKRKFRLIHEDSTYYGNFIIVSNIKRYAGFLKLTPNALLSDNYFDILILNADSFFKVFIFILKTIFSFNSKNIKRLKCDKVIIEGECISQVDGEIADELPLVINKGEEIRFEVP